MTTVNNTAAPQAAGYILQLERALYHLATADAGASVAVEHVDDVAVSKNGRVTVQEQDKGGTTHRREPLYARSKALWRTLQIWTTQRFGPDNVLCDRYLLVVEGETKAPVAQLIKGLSSGDVRPESVVEALRFAGKRRSKSKIQEIIDDVLGHSDERLLELVTRVEIVELADDDHGVIANGLAIDTQVDREMIIDGLLGWVTRTLRAAWREDRPGLISREACIRQCRALEASQARRRFLPRPAREVSVSETQRGAARVRPFVDHLSRIDAGEDDVYQAVDHFIQFNLEKYRLAAEGEVPVHEWDDRGHRLKQRWRNVMRVARRETPSGTRQDVGHRVLERSTYEHLEPLGGEACGELYMTAGHYHRLADEDEVWWDPQFKPTGA